MVALGIRKIEKREGHVQASTYYYRPERVARRLLEASARPGEAGDEDARRRLGEYGARAALLAARLAAR
jgi:hypothetical protein